MTRFHARRLFIASNDRKNAQSQAIIGPLVPGESTLFPHQRVAAAFRAGRNFSRDRSCARGNDGAIAARAVRNVSGSV